MVDGETSVSVNNAIQTEGTTLSDLYYRVDAANGFIDIIGTVIVYDIDETAVAGSLSVTIMADSTHILNRVLTSTWRIPVSLGYHSTITDVEPVAIKGGYNKKRC